jgi:hypothetical protein
MVSVEVNNCRPARVQDNTTSWILRSPTFRRLAEVAAGLYDVVSRHGLCRITSELIETVEDRPQLRECVEGTMSSLRKVQALLFSEHTLDEAV